tara:strand:- start:4909 stop:5169 length:261 start_codon:yes stop_codon:yes gene_type:complete
MIIHILIDNWGDLILGADNPPPGYFDSLNQNYNDLVLMFGEDVADDLINGILIVSVKGQAVQGETAYLILRNTNGEIFSVHPYVFE